MTRTINLTLCAALTLGCAAFANNNPADPKSAVEQLRTEARAAQKTALELSTALKSKKADLSVAPEKLAAVEKNYSTIQELITGLEAQAGDWDGARKASLEKAKQVSAVMKVFIDNKKALVNDGLDSADREKLRLNAEGVAVRAELLDKTLRNLGI